MYKFDMLSSKSSPDDCEIFFKWSFFSASGGHCPLPKKNKKKLQVSIALNKKSPFLRPHSIMPCMGSKSGLLKSLYKKKISLATCDAPDGTGPSGHHTRAATVLPC